MPDASYLITAYLIVLTVFSLWVNSRSQTVWDALRADGALYAAAGRPSDMYFVFDIYRLCYRYAFFLKNIPPDRRSLPAPTAITVRCAGWRYFCCTSTSPTAR